MLFILSFSNKFKHGFRYYAFLVHLLGRAHAYQLTLIVSHLLPTHRREHLRAQAESDAPQNAQHASQDMNRFKEAFKHIGYREATQPELQTADASSATKEKEAGSSSSWLSWLVGGGNASANCSAPTCGPQKDISKEQKQQKIVQQNLRRSECVTSLN